MRAAEDAERSLNQELERRLERSFELEQLDERLEAVLRAQIDLDLAGARINQMTDRLTTQVKEFREQMEEIDPLKPGRPRSATKKGGRQR